MTRSKDILTEHLRRVCFTSGIVMLTLPFTIAGAGCARPGDQEATASSIDPVVAALATIPRHPHQAVCDEAAVPGRARCLARVRTHPDGTIVSMAAPAGIARNELVSAYNLPTSGGQGRIVAIVDAQDDPSAEADLAVYRKQYGLPPCTTANGCFKKVNQNGQASSYPSADEGWAGEISLDLDMVSAVCPDCKILLVEANTASMDDLGAAVKTAVKMGAAAISNSYGGPEDDTVQAASDQYFNFKGVFITAASGDSGYGVSFPASSPYVVAVGGTSLTQGGGSRGWAEGAWSSGGSGCSANFSKPSYQKDSGCAKRTVADVAAVADPNTGLAVYDSYGSFGGWTIVGGTSASSPIVAAIFALTGKTDVATSFPYANSKAFYDVTTGSNGSCSPSDLCNAGPGYDGPTGVGSPNGAAIEKVSGGGGGGGGGSPDGGVEPPPPPPPDGGVEPPPPAPDGGVEPPPPAPDAGQGGGGTGGTCSHSECTAGKALDPSCDACAAKVCAADSFCCSDQWDWQCVFEAFDCPNACK